jgi:hypothetical protein
MSGEIIELDVIEAVNRVDWILANKELKVIQLQPRISKEIRCFKDGKYYGHYLLPENVDCIYHIGDGCFWNVGCSNDPHRILRESITADLSSDCHISTKSQQRFPISDVQGYVLFG